MPKLSAFGRILLSTKYLNVLILATVGLSIAMLYFGNLISSFLFSVCCCEQAKNTTATNKNNDIFFIFAYFFICFSHIYTVRNCQTANCAINNCMSYFSTPSNVAISSPICVNVSLLPIIKQASTLFKTEKNMLSIFSPKQALFVEIILLSLRMSPER